MRSSPLRAARCKGQQDHMRIAHDFQFREPMPPEVISFVYFTVTYGFKSMSLSTHGHFAFIYCHFERPQGVEKSTI